MSEQRRATLTPFGKSDKNTKKALHKTFRLRFTLSDPSEDSCPVFDYGSVVKTEEKKFIKKNHEGKSNGVIDSFDSDDDVKRIARKFEEKYGDKKSKCKSYAELGAGYDETDPFIDNTEACDEAIQEDQETFCGGYYINSGPLELKRVEVSDHSDADEMGKRKNKKLSVIEEDEETEDRGSEEAVEGEAEPDIPEIKMEPDVDSEIKSVSEEPKVTEEKSRHHIYQEDLPKKKKKRLSSEDRHSGEDTHKTKKPKTVKDILEEKRAFEPTRVEPEKKIASITSISEAIESVVNARNNDENSNCSNSSQSAVASSTSEDSQEGKTNSQITPTSLPDNLSPEILNLVEQIKNTAGITDNTKKTFCADINNFLVKMEWKCRDLSATSRNLIFSHLAYYLPCTKDTLTRRAKKLFIHKEESQIDTVICKLKATIDATMPSLLERYAKECQRIIEERGTGTNTTHEATPGGENQKNPESSSPKLPKRKFPWTDETRGYLREIVRLKNRCYKVLKPRKSTCEEYVSGFLHSKVRLLWPSGWMKTSVLHKECNRSPHSGRFKHLSNHSHSRNESSGHNASDSFSSPAAPNGTSLSLHLSANLDSPHQPITSPPMAGCTPEAAKPAGDPINLLTKITTSLNSSSSNPKKSSGNHHHSRAEKGETFSMDCLLKRTSENTNCNDYNAFDSELSKNETVIINGASLPLKNVNSNANESIRSDNILDLSSCNSGVSGTPSVIQCTNERTAKCISDSVSTNLKNTNKHPSSPLSSNKEVSSHISNRKQRLLQLNPQPNWLSQASCDNKKTDNVYQWPHAAHKSTIPEAKKPKPVPEERRMSEETTTATDILSQIISESLRTPSQPIPTSTSYNSKAFDDEKSGASPIKGQELFFDVMQDLKELNNLSSGGLLDSKHDSKSNSYLGSSWSHTKKPDVSTNNTSQFQSQFLKHLMNSQETPHSPLSSPTYTRHNASPYENSQYMNDINKPTYNTPHRTAQAMSSHSGSPSKESRLNQGCIMKPLQNIGISSGHANRYMPPVEYGSDDQHLLGLASGLQYWPYPGNESQSHQ